MMAAVGGRVTGQREVWWRRWLVSPVKAQLTQGITVERISWTIALGCVIGVFPIMGTPTIVCLAAGWALRLNHPLMQVSKELVYPLHLALILVFIKSGELLFGSSLIIYSIPEMMGRFKDDPSRFVRDFGVAAGQGVCAWLLVAPFAALLIKLAITPAVRRLAASLTRQNGGEP